MIILKNVTKTYKARFGTRLVLDDISMTINPGEKIGILGRNGAGKSTLLRIIAGTEKSTKGAVHRAMTVSWPMGISGGLQGTLSGIDNLKFICRIYGLEINQKIRLIEEITELGKYLREPVATYSSGMRTKLALAISVILDFDCFLLDESLSLGDKNFQEKYRLELKKKREQSALILVSHVESQIKEFAETLYVLNNGKLRKFEFAKNAYNFYNELKRENHMELG